MGIGTKIKEARLVAQLTQEQAAEALGVSRQTMSNWENDKTYPDIVSIIKMSDLYDVSLDRLLKENEGTTTSNYIDYLKESTNVVKGKEKSSKIILIATYLGIWTFAVLIFWLFISGSDAMGYSIVFLWIILPISTLVISLLIGKNDYWGKMKWIALGVFGFMQMLAEYATFSVRNMIAIEFMRINIPHFELLLMGAIISVVGLGIGTLIARCKTKHE